MTFSASSLATGGSVEHEDGLDVLGPPLERARRLGDGDATAAEPRGPSRHARLRGVEVADSSLEVTPAGVDRTEHHPIAEDHLAVPGREVDGNGLLPAGDAGQDAHAVR